MESPEKRRKSIYLLPNLFTTGTLFGGFYAMIAAIQGRFDIAAVAVFLSMIADALDGRVARLTNTTSDFGKEYDSLADMVTFGLVPALIIYLWALKLLVAYEWLGWVGDRLGWLGAFVYVAAAALRLARFNLDRPETDDDSSYFEGLPSPAAAAVVVGFVWVCVEFGLSGDIMAIPAFFVTVVIGGLMVSSVPYISFKDVNLRKGVPFAWILGVVMAFLLIAFNPPSVLFLAFGAYALSGLVLGGWQYGRDYLGDRKERA